MARPSSGPDLPDAAFVMALTGLTGMGPARLTALLEHHSPEEAWALIEGGHAVDDPAVAKAGRGLNPALARRWQAAAQRIDPTSLWQQHDERGISVLLRSDPAFPVALRDDLEAPAVLFSFGSLEALDAPRVAIVGTRRCTWAGRGTAFELGHDLAEAGVCVVSGLALGIDGAAHSGALAATPGASRWAPPVAVVATGLDVVYPARHADLWRRVSCQGAIVSEYPLGTPPERWRFPARNRLIAALADVVVVVESHARGGSMHTVEAALERDRAVMAVPGPVRSPASRGTNGLLVAGVGPVRDANDVLSVLGLDHQASTRSSRQGTVAPEGPSGAVLEAVGWEASTIEQVAARLGASLGQVAVTLSELERDGWLVRTGAWFERRAAHSE